MRARYLTLALVGLLATRAACNVQISTDSSGNLVLGAADDTIEVPGGFLIGTLNVTEANQRLLLDVESLNSITTELQQQAAAAVEDLKTKATVARVETVVSDLASAKIDLQTTIDDLQTAQQDIVTAQQAADEAAKVAKAADAAAGGKAAGGTFWTASLYTSNAEVDTDNFCGSRTHSLKVVGVGFVPDVAYGLSIRSVAKPDDRSLSLDVSTLNAKPIEGNYYTTLDFNLVPLFKAWSAKNFPNEEVAISVTRDGAALHYAGTSAGNVVKVVETKAGDGKTNTNTVKVGLSQMVYGEMTEPLKATSNIPFDNSRPGLAEGAELVKVKITPLHDDSELVISATITATERADTADNWVATITRQAGGKNFDTVCSGVEELMGDLRDFMQTIHITCIISTKMQGWRDGGGGGKMNEWGVIKAGVENEFVLRAGIPSGSLCVNCVDDKYGIGGGSILSGLMIQEYGPEVEVGCAEASKMPAVARTVQHKFAQGNTKDTSQNDLTMLQEHQCRNGCNVAPKYGDGDYLEGVKITPSSKDSLIIVEAQATGVSACNGNPHGGNTNRAWNVCVFKKGGGDGGSALVCGTDEQDGEHCYTQQMETVTVQRVIVAGTTDELLFALHVGMNEDKYFYGPHNLNQASMFGGRLFHSISVREVLPAVKLTPAMFAKPDQSLPGNPLGKLSFDRFTGIVTASAGHALPAAYNGLKPKVNEGYTVGDARDIQATHTDSVLEIRCQAWMVEHTNTANSAAICLWMDDTLLTCGCEEETRGWTFLHGIWTRYWYKPGNTDTHRYRCNAGVDGGEVDYNGMRNGQPVLDDTLWSGVTIIEHLSTE